MRMPFERLMEYAAGLSKEDESLGLGELAARVGESPDRLCDALTALRVMAGERTCISPSEVRAATDPVVRRAREADQRGVMSGFAEAAG
jgi:hypothetical protein